MFLFNNVFLPQDEGMSCYHRIMACFLPRTAFGEGLSQVEQVKRRMEETRAEMDDEREGHELRMDEYRGELRGIKASRGFDDPKLDFRAFVGLWLTLNATGSRFCYDDIRD